MRGRLSGSGIPHDTAKATQKPRNTDVARGGIPKVPVDAQNAIFLIPGRAIKFLI